MAPHSGTLAWKIPRAEEPGRLQSTGSLRVRHDWATSLSLSCTGEGNGNPLQCSCLENPRDGGARWAAVYGEAQSRTRLTRLSIGVCCSAQTLLTIPWWSSSLTKSRPGSLQQWEGCATDLSIWLLTFAKTSPQRFNQAKFSQKPLLLPCSPSHPGNETILWPIFPNKVTSSMRALSLSAAPDSQ